MKKQEQYKTKKNMRLSVWLSMQVSVRIFNSFRPKKIPIAHVNKFNNQFFLISKLSKFWLSKVFNKMV